MKVEYLDKEFQDVSRDELLDFAYYLICRYDYHDDRLDRTGFLKGLLQKKLKEWRCKD